MSKVTRWGEAGHSYGDTWMEPTDDGEWVLWEDYEALAKELETCKKYREAYEKCDQIATQRVRELEADRDRLAEEIGHWRSNLSGVMPADFKDWHQNSPSEWPDIAANLILRLRDRERDAWLEVDRLVAQLAEARAEGWRKGIEAADVCPDDPENDAVTDTHLSATIRALPLPADLREAVDMISGK